MNIRLPENECVGCGVCAEGCPAQAIIMRENTEGFLYPEIVGTRCTQCGKCMRNCVALQKTVQTDIRESVYATVHKSPEVLQKSSSGGMFSALAMWIIGQGGTVFGAAFDEKGMLSHQAANNQNELAKLLGSKYVQSNLYDALPLLKEKADAGEKVLICGTPCQIGAVKAFLGARDNVYLVDFLCHGVGSPKVFDFYSRKIAKGRPEKIAFRDKRISWRAYSVRIQSAKVRYCKYHQDDLYMRGYLQNLFLRKSCYTCSAQDKMHASDITIGDFFDIAKYDATFADERGTGKAIVHTSKGEALLQAAKEDCRVKKIEHTAMEQHQNIAMHKERDAFFEGLSAENILKKLKKYTVSPPFKVWLYRKIKYRCK
ncbi:MAG: Coenzyme F420 hydrogenase/dehydrogenase, beta subunit C-terminal domain [Clostridia bacterium]|nr:Coenzyme F420 hydrogenase/dehydrogenase, beta subunit C-terminal domain [Clostridia bacterium]